MFANVATCSDVLDEQENAPHDGDTEVVIVNELLAYCAFHADRSTTDAIRDVLVRFYTPDEINSAKNELYDECFDVLGVAPVHRDTAARGAHVIAAKEIVDGIRKVDAAEVEVRPQFAAIKLDRLPQYGPEELDLTSLVVRLREVERHCNRLDGQMAECNKTVTTLTDDHARTAGSYAMATKRGEAAQENVQRPPKVVMAARPAYQATVTKARLPE